MLKNKHHGTLEKANIYKHQLWVQKSDAYKKMSVVSIVTIKGQTAVLEQTLKLKTGIQSG